MLKPEIEAWVLRIHDHVVRGRSVEDSRVELKAEWPEPTWAARRIAAHCNAAPDQFVLWIIGLDETNGVVSAESQYDIADWWSMVRGEFDQFAPSLTDLMVPVGERHVTALLFDRSRAPFVVRNPAFGRKEGGSVEREVPWREGTAIRTARREDLIRLLLPQLLLPEIEVLYLSVRAREGPWKYSPETGDSRLTEPPHFINWQVKLRLYVAARSDRSPVLAISRARSTLFFEEGLQVHGIPKEAEYLPCSPDDVHHPDPHAMSVRFHETRSNHSELIVSEPATAELQTVLQSDWEPGALHDQLRLMVEIPVVGLTDQVSISKDLGPAVETGWWEAVD